jgi:hypothetical protein
MQGVWWGTEHSPEDEKPRVPLSSLAARLGTLISIQERSL